MHGDRLKQLNEVLMEKNELVSRNNLMTNQITKLSEDLAQKYVCCGCSSERCAMRVLDSLSPSVMLVVVGRA